MPVIFDGTFQYLLEFLYVIIFIPFVFKPQSRYVAYLSLVYLFLFISLFYQDSLVFMLNFKLFSVLFVSICCSSFLKQVGLNFRPVINIFFCINLLASFFLPVSFSQLIAFQDGLVTSGLGGLFFHFHLNAFMTALWFLSLPFKSLPFHFLSFWFLLRTQSKYVAFSYLIAIFLRHYLPIVLRFISRNRFIVNCFLAFSSLSSLFFVLFNRDYISSLLFSLDRSAYVIFEQFFKSLSVLPGFFPGDITQLYSHYFSYDLLSGSEISNEIALISISYRLGILAFFVLSFVLFKLFRSSVTFLFLTLLHYTFLYTPLTYILLYNVNPPAPRIMSISASPASA